MKNKELYTGAAILAAAGVATLVMNRKKNPPLEVAPYVEIEKYMGEWYEIARMPASFEKNCFGAKAVYSLRKDGSVKVQNTCRIGSLDGKLKEATGKAYVVDKATNAKLKVRFFWPVKGDYWILEVGDHYEYALVGEPSREYLWILSRKPYLRQRTIDKLLARAQDSGFDTSTLIFTEQPQPQRGFLASLID